MIKFEDLKDPNKNTCATSQEKYKTYILKERDIDAEKATMGNPLLATFVPQLFQYMKMYTDDDITRIHKEFMNDMVRNFANKASHQGKEIFSVVGKYFDVQSWWKESNQMFPHVFPSTTIWILKPAMNAFQERVFSMSSWFDSNHLMHCQTAKTFEMHVLECIMRKLCKDIIVRELDLAMCFPIFEW